MEHSLSEINRVSFEPSLTCRGQKAAWKANLLKVVQGSDHEAGVFTGEFVSSLSHVDWLKSVLSPELEQFFGDTE